MDNICEFCNINTRDRKISSVFNICHSCWKDGHKCPSCGSLTRKYKIFCSKVCRYKNPRITKILSESVSKTNLRDSKKISYRMRTNNPTSNKSVLNKIISTKKKNGTLNKPPIKRGGNGTFTDSQLKLNKCLNWSLELPIKTVPDSVPLGSRKAYVLKRNIATNYKVDIGNKITKLAIEIDGHSHYGRRKCLDLKKEKCLKKLGWTVLRFTNQEVMANFSKVLFRILKRNRVLLRSMT